MIGQTFEEFANQRLGVKEEEEEKKKPKSFADFATQRLKQATQPVTPPVQPSPTPQQPAPTRQQPQIIKQPSKFSELTPPSQYPQPSAFEKPSTGQKIANTVYEAMRGFVEEALLNIPEFPKPGEASPTAQRAGEAVGRFAGFITGAPMKFGKMGSDLLLKGIKAARKSKAGIKALGKELPYVERILERLSGESLQLGIASALSEVEDVKGMPGRFKSGAIFGAIFGGMRWANIKKMPLLSQIFRQAGTRALARTANLYQLPYENIEQWQSPDAVQRIFDELLFTWFSAKGAKPEEIFRDLQKIQVEVQKSGANIQVWNPYQDPTVQRAMRKIPANIVTGSGEVIPAELFSWKLKMSDFKDMNTYIKQLKAPEGKEPGKAPPKRELKFALRDNKGKTYIEDKPVTNHGELALDLMEKGIDIDLDTAVRGFIDKSGKWILGSEGRKRPGMEEPAEVVKPEKPKAEKEQPITMKEVQEAIKTSKVDILKESTAPDVISTLERLEKFRRPTDTEIAERAMVERGRYIPSARPEKKPEPKIRKDYPEEYIKEQNKLLKEKGKIPTFEEFAEKVWGKEKPEKPKPKLTTERKRQLLKERGLLVEEKPKGKAVVEKTEGKIEPLTDAEIERAKKAGLVEEVPPSERSRRAVGKGLEYAKGELDDVYAGLHIPKLVRQFDTYLEKKYGTRIETSAPPEKAEVNSTINSAQKEVREKAPIPGLKVINNFRRFGEPGKELADKSVKYIKNFSQATQGDIFKLKSAYELIGSEIRKSRRISRKTSRQIAKRMFDLMEGKAEPKTEAEHRGFEILDSIRKEKANTSKELGLKIQTMFGEKDWQPLENYAPVEYENLPGFLDADAFKHLRDRYIEKIAKKTFGDLYKQDKATALREAELYFEEFRTDLKTRPFGHLERQRLLDESILEELRIEWKKKYPGKKFPLERKRTLDVLVKYISGSNNRLEWIRQFGKDVRWGDKGYVPEKLLEITRKLSKGRSQRYVRNFFNKYLRQSAALDTRITKLIRTIRTVQLTKLAFAWIPNSLQWFTNTLPQTPLRDWPRALWDAAKFYGVAGKKQKAKIRKWFSTTGASTLKQAVQLAMMESPSKVNAVADIMLKAHLFSGTEFFNAMFSASAGARKARTLSERLYKGRGKSWRSPFYRSELKRMGLSEADIERIIRDGPLTEKDIQNLADAAFHMRRYSQFLADAFHLPKTWSSPAGRLLTQFKNFAFNQTSMLWGFMRDAMKFAKSGGREGDISKLMKASVALPVAGALVTTFKKWLYPKIGIHFYEELMAGKSWPMKLLVYILNTGNLGLAADVLMSFQYGKAGITSLIGGPTYADIAELAESLGKTTQEIMTAIEHKNPEWIKHRAESIKFYWLKFAERISPDLRLVIHNFFKDYRQLKSAGNWTRMVTEAYKKYKQLYKLQSPSAANEFWNAFMRTQGKEYQEIFKKKPKKPSPKEVEKWWEEQKKTPTERFRTPGTSKDSGEKTEFWY